MKRRRLILIVLIIVILSNCNQKADKNKETNLFGIQKNKVNAELNYLSINKEEQTKENLTLPTEKNNKKTPFGIIEKKEFNSENSKIINNEKKTSKLKEVQISGLEDKKFYRLEKNNKGKLYLVKYPQYTGDFEMEKFTFSKGSFVDGFNVMEPTEWDVLKILKKDSIINYVLSMKGNLKYIDTLNLIYLRKKGVLYHKVNNTSRILIDSSKSKSIKILNKYHENDE